MLRYSIVSIFFLTCATASSATELEWKGYDSQWCLIGGSRQICLPKQFWPVEFGKWHAFFSNRDGNDSSVVRIEYFVSQGGTNTDAKNKLPISYYILENTTEINGIDVYQYSIDQEKAAIPGVFVVVLELPGRFVFHITGGVQLELDGLSKELASQWVDLK